MEPLCLWMRCPLQVFQVPCQPGGIKRQVFSQVKWDQGLCSLLFSLHLLWSNTWQERVGLAYSARGNVDQVSGEAWWPECENPDWTLHPWSGSGERKWSEAMYSRSPGWDQVGHAHVGHFIFKPQKVFIKLTGASLDFPILVGHIIHSPLQECHLEATTEWSPFTRCQAYWHTSLILKSPNL